MRKVYVDIGVRLIIQIDEGIEVAKVLDEMDYKFIDTTGSANIVDTEILNYEIEDSK